MMMIWLAIWLTIVKKIINSEENNNERWIFILVGMNMESILFLISCFLPDILRIDKIREKLELYLLVIIRLFKN